MKVVLVAHGFPPDEIGGTELHVQALAQALLAAGHGVAVVAGSTRRSARGAEVEVVEERDPSGARVHRVHRPDLYFDHWHKLWSPRVARALRGVLRTERPDVVHVHHWLRLSSDLVLAAAREGVPAVVTLHDLWTSCPIAFRVRPAGRTSCVAPVGAHPCIACAGTLPPRTPWVPREAQHMLLAERQRDLGRELELARARIAPTRAHATALAGFLGLDAAMLACDVVPPLRGARLTPGEPLASPAQLGHVELGAWGHLAPHKGQDLVLSAIDRPRLRDRVRVHFAGGVADREYARELRDRARGLDVCFHGPYRVADLARHPAARVHALVSGSRAHESYGTVLDEARDLELPAIVPRQATFAERAESEQLALELYEPGDADALAGALERLLVDRRAWPDLRRRAALARPRAPDEGELLQCLIGIYERARAAGAPTVPSEQWYEARMRDAALDAWDRSLSSRSARELGLEA